MSNASSDSRALLPPPSLPKEKEPSLGPFEKPPRVLNVQEYEFLSLVSPKDRETFLGGLEKNGAPPDDLQKIRGFLASLPRRICQPSFDEDRLCVSSNGKTYTDIAGIASIFHSWATSPTSETMDPVCLTPGNFEIPLSPIELSYVAGLDISQNQWRLLSHMSLWQFVARVEGPHSLGKKIPVRHSVISTLDYIVIDEVLVRFARYIAKVADLDMEKSGAYKAASLFKKFPRMTIGEFVSKIAGRFNPLEEAD